MARQARPAAAAAAAGRQAGGRAVVQKGGQAPVHLLDDGLEPVLELAAVLGARDERAHVQGHEQAPLERLGHVACVRVRGGGWVCKCVCVCVWRGGGGGRASGPMQAAGPAPSQAAGRERHPGPPGSQQQPPPAQPPARPSGPPATMRCARPSATAVLPTPGSPISTGLFLVRLLRIWMARRTSSSRPITGSSFPSRAAAVRSRAYLVSASYLPSGSWSVTCAGRAVGEGWVGGRLGGS
jgi:hypothetical protein